MMMYYIHSSVYMATYRSMQRGWLSEDVTAHYDNYILHILLFRRPRTLTVLSTFMSYYYKYTL